MTDPRPEVTALLDRAKRLGEGQAQIALLEEAVRVADLHADADLGYLARKKLIWPAYNYGRYDLLLVHFAWCLAHADRHPDRYRLDMLWSYRWVVNSLPAYPEVSRRQIEEAMADMARRYREAGFSLRPVHVLRRDTYQAMGDRTAAAAAGKEIDRCPRDRLSDSLETEVAFKVYYLVFAKKYRQAVATAAPLLDGRMRDPHFESMTRCDLLLPLVRLGRVEDARRFQKQAYPYACRNPRFTGWVADHVEFLAVTGDLAPAVRLAERHLPVLLTRPAKSARFTFFYPLRLLADRLRVAGKDRATLKAPEGFAPGGPPVRVGLDELTAWLDRELHEMAAAFDGRNGTDYKARKLAELPALNRLADRLARGVSP